MVAPNNSLVFGAGILKINRNMVSNRPELDV